MADSTAFEVTRAFTAGLLDLSARQGAPVPGWDGMPEVYSATRVTQAGADAPAVRTFLTLTAALDYSRNSDRLWTASAGLFMVMPWLFDPEELLKRREEAAEALRKSGVSQRHTRDCAAWLRIAEVLRLGLSEEVSTVVEAGTGDAVTLLGALDRVGSDRQSLFPLLRGPKIGPRGYPGVG